MIGNVGKYAIDTVESSTNTLEPATCPRCQWEYMQQFVLNVRPPSIHSYIFYIIICCWGGLEENILHQDGILICTCTTMFGGLFFGTQFQRQRMSWLPLVVHSFGCMTAVRCMV